MNFLAHLGGGSQNFPRGAPPHTPLGLPPQTLPGALPQTPLELPPQTPKWHLKAGVAKLCENVKLLLGARPDLRITLLGALFWGVFGFASIY